MKRFEGECVFKRVRRMKEERRKKKEERARHMKLNSEGGGKVKHSGVWGLKPA